MGCLTSKEPIKKFDTLEGSPRTARPDDDLESNKRRRKRKATAPAVDDHVDSNGAGMKRKKKKRKRGRKRTGLTSSDDSLAHSLVDMRRLLLTLEHASIRVPADERLLAYYIKHAGQRPAKLPADLAPLEDNIVASVRRWIDLQQDASALAEDVTRMVRAHRMRGVDVTHLGGVVRHLREWVAMRCRTGGSTGVWGARDSAEWRRFSDTLLTAITQAEAATAGEAPPPNGTSAPSSTPHASPRSTPPVAPKRSSPPPSPKPAPAHVEIARCASVVSEWMLTQESFSDVDMNASGPFSPFNQVLAGGNGFAANLLVDLSRRHPTNSLDADAVDRVLQCLGEIANCGAQSSEELTPLARAITQTHINAGDVDVTGCKQVGDVLWSTVVRTFLVDADDMTHRNMKTLWDAMWHAVLAVLDQAPKDVNPLKGRGSKPTNAMIAPSPRATDKEKQVSPGEGLGLVAPNVTSPTADVGDNGVERDESIRKTPGTSLTWSFRNQEQLNEFEQSGALDGPPGDELLRSSSILGKRAPSRSLTIDGKRMSSDGRLGNIGMGEQLKNSTSIGTQSDNLPRASNDNPVYLHKDADFTEGSLAEWGESSSMTSSMNGGRPSSASPSHGGRREVQPAKAEPSPPPKVEPPPPPPKPKGISMAAVAQRNSRTDCWIVVKSKVYDVTPFLSSHPGGVSVIMKYAGKNCTKEFTDIHSSYAWSRLQEFFVDEVAK